MGWPDVVGYTAIASVIVGGLVTIFRPKLDKDVVTKMQNEAALLYQLKDELGRTKGDVVVLGVKADALHARVDTLHDHVNSSIENMQQQLSDISDTMHSNHNQIVDILLERKQNK